MSLPVKSFQDLYNLFINTLQSVAPQLTDTLAGSELDALAAVFALSGVELTRYMTLQFNKTFFELAGGPEITGASDDLQTLATDHFGTLFARPAATKMTDTATFSRATAAAGAVTISAGTVIKTVPDSLGNVYRYTTNADLTLTGSGAGSLSGSVAITAVLAGKASNAAAGTITAIETSLLDSTITVTNAGSSNGTDAQDDATYRETIRNLIQTLRGATKSAIVAEALTVSGVAYATPVETEEYVMPWNVAGNAAVVGATYFVVPAVILYIADSTGNASGTLISNVQTALEAVRAYGINIQVTGGVGAAVNWTLKLTLNHGPNYTTFQKDTTLIQQSMTNYINSLGVGVGFTRSTAEAAILAIWGASGTNDLTTVTSTIPAGDVAGVTGTKLIAGTIATA